MMISKLASKLPSSVQQRGVGLLDALLQVRRSLTGTYPVYSIQYDDTVIQYPLKDARSLLYLRNCVSNGRIQHEGLSVKYFSNIDADLAVDIGAHLGVYTGLIAALSDVPLIVYEPDIYNAWILESVLNANGDGVIDIRPVTDTEKEMKFYKGDNVVSNGHTLNPEGSNQQFRPIKKQTVKLSNELRRRDVDSVFLKIDAEGSELVILKDVFQNTNLEHVEGIVEVHRDRLPENGEQVLSLLDDHEMETHQVKESQKTPAYHFQG